MFKLELECRILAEDQDTGYWRRRVVTGRDIYNFTVALATALFEMHSEAGQYNRATEQDEMEKSGELPF